MDLQLKKFHLTSALWYTDTPGKMDATNDENEGLSNRRNLMGEEKNIDMIGYLHCDIFNQHKLLINGVEVHVRLVRSRDSFCLMDPTGLYTA